MHQTHTNTRAQREKHVDMGDNGRLDDRLTSLFRNIVFKIDSCIKIHFSIIRVRAHTRTRMCTDDMHIVIIDRSLYNGVHYNPQCTMPFGCNEQRGIFPSDTKINSCCVIIIVVIDSQLATDLTSHQSAADAGRTGLFSRLLLYLLLKISRRKESTTVHCG